jgi:hypothetical protein
MGSYDPFEHLQHKLWPKERSGVKLTIWFLTTESQESIKFLCVQVAYDMPLESFWRGLQLRFKPHPDRRFAPEVIAPQSCRTPNLGDQKAIRMPLSRGGAKYTIWGKVVASPESGLWWVLWVQGCPWLVLAPKVLQPCANQLVCWSCVRLLEWVSCLTLFLVPSWSFSTTLYPSKVLRIGSVPWVLNLSIVSILRFNLNLPRDLGACHHTKKTCSL